MSERNSFKFIHCADLHLDSPFEGMHSVYPEIGEILRNATFQAFNRIIDIAIQEKVNFIVIAGDVYDGADRSLRAQLKFRDGLAKAAAYGIQCFVSHGNHDPLSGWEAGLSMPEGVYSFGGNKVEKVSAKIGKEPIAFLSGYSYPVREVKENLVPQFKKDGSSLFHIGVLHCNVGGDPNHGNYAPCSLDDLIQSGIDYWALGHIHTRKIIREQSPCVIYPGNTQGRNTRESGKMGCYLVQVQQNGISQAEFVPTDIVRWIKKEIDITDWYSIDEIREAISDMKEESRGESEGRGVILQLKLVGRGEMHSLLQRVELEKDLAIPMRFEESQRSDFVWIESIHLNTKPGVDIEQRRKVEDFVGDFLRTTDSYRKNREGMDDLRKILLASKVPRAISSVLENMTNDDLKMILDEAELLGLNHLLGED